MSYDDAYQLLKRFGRKSNKGIGFPQFLRKQNGGTINGYRFVKVEAETVFDRDYKGRYVVRIKQGKLAHVVPLIDGIYYDEQSIPEDPNLDICTIWEAISEASQRERQ